MSSVFILGGEEEEEYYEGIFLWYIPGIQNSCLSHKNIIFSKIFHDQKFFAVIKSVSQSLLQYQRFLFLGKKK